MTAGVSQRVLLTAALVVAAVSLPSQVLAQAPGPPTQPQVQVNGQNVLITFLPTGPAAAGYSIAAQFNGVTIPGSPFFVGGATTIPAGPIAPGSYTIQVIATNAFGSTSSQPTTFIVGGGGGIPSTPAMRPAVVAGNVVTLHWDPVANATGYDVEAVVQATGQTFLLPVGNQTTLAVPNVPFGNYVVRVRGRNAFGVGSFSNQVIVVVGVVLGSGDMQITLTWNTTVDMDIHVIEPNGRHVYFASRQGTTARLDVDDLDGFGPENIFVGAAGAAAGTYQVYLVHYSGNVPTTSTIAITLRSGGSAQTALFTRQTSVGNPGVGFNVANVNVLTGQLVETGGTRGGLEAGPTSEVKK